MAYDAGTAILQVVPSFKDVETKIARELRQMARAFGDELERSVGKGLVEATDKVAQDAGKNLAKNLTKGLGDSAAEAAKAAEPSIRKAEEHISKARLEAARGTEQQLAQLQEKAAQQRAKFAEGFAAGREQAQARRERDLLADQVRAADQRLRAARQEILGREKQADAARARAFEAERRAVQQLDDLHEAAFKEDARRLKQMRALQQAEAAKAFARTFAGRAQAGTQASAATLPDIEIKINDDSVRNELARIRTEVAALGNLKVGIDVDVEDFLDQAEDQFERLRAIAHDVTVEIDVRTDAAGAATELGAVLALAGRIDGADANIDVNVDIDSARARLGAMAQSLEVNLSRLQMMMALGATLGTAIVPAAAGAAAAIGAIGTAALAAAAGIGVMALGFGGVGEAVKALGQAQDNEAKTNKSLIQSQNQIANAIDGVKSARMALANTIANNRDASIAADQAVARANREVAQARRRAAQDAVEATARVASAQRGLARDEISALRAREELTQAYRDAQRAFEDLSSAMEMNSLDQRQAILDIAEAKEDLDKLVGNNRATEEEREQAEITYKRRQLQYRDLQREQRELTVSYAEYVTKGVAGSRQVVDAQQRVADADARIADSRRAVAAAQQAQRQQEIDGRQAIADALTRLATEETQRESQRRQAAYSMATAQQSLVSAQRSLASAYTTAGTAGGAAMDKVNTAMSKLSPTARTFARFIHGLRDDFFALRGAAADGMLSGLQTALEMARPYLPEFAAFVRSVSGKLGELFVRLANSLKDPVFQRFFAYIKDTAVPTLDDLFTIGENLTKGFVGLFLGFTPLSEDVSGGFVKMSESFATWAADLGKNKGFQSFLAYLRENGPALTEFLVAAARAAGQLIKAMAPIGTVVLDILTSVLTAIADIPPETLATIVAGLAGLAAAIGTLSLVTSAMAISATAAIIAGVVAAVAAAAAGITILFQRVKPLREFFKTLWEDLKEVFRRVWAEVEPVLEDLGQAALKLWHGAIVPAFKGIIAVAQDLWVMLKPIFGLIGTILKIVGGIVWWLFKNVVVPAFKGIVAVIVNVLVPVIKWLYLNIVKPIFASIGVVINIAVALIKVALGTVMLIIKGLGALFVWLYQKAIKPAWDWMKPFFIWMRDIISKHVQPHWEKAIKALGGFWDWLKQKARVPIKFIVETLLNDGLLKGYNWLADKFNVEPKNVKIPPPKGGWARGGVIDVLPGYSPGVDNHRFFSPTGGVIDLSGGEGVLRPELTRAVLPWLNEGNAVARRGGYGAVQQWLGGYANGGRVPGGDKRAKGGPGDWWGKIKEKASDVFTGIKSFITDPAGSIKLLVKRLINMLPGKDTAIVQRFLAVPNKVMTDVVNKVKNLFMGGEEEGAGTPGSAGGLGGSAGMMRILRAVFPGLPLNSGFRPGAVTTTGKQSMHALNRAVDVPPRMDVFEWIRANFPNSRELIFSPAGPRQLWKGVEHFFTGITRQNHFDHVHWSYDQGGWLPDTRQMPGQTMAVFHGRRQPDAVLTDQQWSIAAKAMASQVRSGSGRGDTYNFEFENSTLTAERLHAIQQRRDVLERVDRPNW